MSDSSVQFDRGHASIIIKRKANGSRRSLVDKCVGLLDVRAQFKLRQGYTTMQYNITAILRYNSKSKHLFRD